MHIGLHVSTRYSSSIFKKLEYSKQFFEKYPNIKRHENPPIGAELFHVDKKDGRTDMKKLKALFEILRTPLIIRLTMYAASLSWCVRVTIIPMET